MADFQDAWEKLKEKNIGLVAGSTDSADNARKLTEKQYIEFPLVYGLDAEAVAGATGAYYDASDKYLHASGFLLNPDKSVRVACYSSGPIGRITPTDVLKLVKLYRKTDA